MIEKLNQPYREVLPEGSGWIDHPSPQEFTDKINEIVDYLNKKEQDEHDRLIKMVQV